MNLFLIIPFVGVVGILCAFFIYFMVLKHDEGNDRMKEIGSKIHDGAMVFLKREYTIIALFMVIVFIILSKFISFYSGIAYIFGGGCSLFAGFLGMKAATRSGTRTTQAAIKGGLSLALIVSFFGGSVMGISVASLGVLGLGIICFFTTNPAVISAFAFGASSVALFARVGGGIYTKAADVGADLVGKVEAGIPEDDPRNPGVIADNVGDCVGDTAGMGADLFESYVGSIIATIAIGAVMPDPRRWVLLPMVLVTIGLISSLLGIFSINIFSSKKNPQTVLRNVTYTSATIFIIGSYFAVNTIIGRMNEFWVVIIGLVAGMLIGIESEYFTSGKPIRKIAKSSESGPAVTIITGLSTGFDSTVLPILTIVTAVIFAYKLSGLYGIALAALGMLSTIGVVMATDSYGPIADNAGGIAEMSGQDKSIRTITDKLDSVGNTTAAIGKGFAIGSAALTSLALFSAYKETAGIFSINLTEPISLVGLFLGALMPFIIAALTMKAVGSVAHKMVGEIRRQFKNIPGIMEGKAEPDTGKCIDIATKNSLQKMIAPGLLAVIAPIFMGLFFGVKALGAFLAGATTVGVLLGIMMTNAGASWDNAKKWIEEGNMGGKGTDVHKAAVIGDTVGDPLKDTSGPSMNILIKLMSIISLLFVPIFVRYSRPIIF